MVYWILLIHLSIISSSIVSNVYTGRHPKISLDDDGDISGKNSQEEDSHADFVEQVAQSEDLTTEDVIATKLDLAKAYVEVSDNDNAKTILDEVLTEGNEEQRKQAQTLLDQI